MGNIEMKKLIISLLVLASSIAISAYSQTVTIDSTFGQNGKTIIPNTSEISFFDFDNHGNIIAVGYTLKEGGKCDLTIAKTNANGIIDISFGDSGVVKVTDYDQIFPIGMKITSDNKIVVIGDFIKVLFQGREILLMRFNEDGSVDQTFGINGQVNLNFNNHSIITLNSENDDFMLIAGIDNQYPYIVKYNYEGEIDNTFGESGITNLPNSIMPFCMRILNNGFIIIAGTYNTHPNNELGLCRLTPVGKIDTDFSNGGIWHMDVMQDFDLDYEYFKDILEDNGGNLVLTGWGLAWKSFICRFNSNGVIDSNFGENGFYCFDSLGISNPIFPIGNKYLTAGWNRWDNHYKIVIVNNNGGFSNEVYTTDINFFKAMNLQENNKIILGGACYINDSDNANFVLERVIIGLENIIKPIEYPTQELVIFPNPAKNYLYFNSEVAFEIVNIQGTILLKSSIPVKSVNIGNLVAGVYFVRVGNSTQKFVKE